MSSLSVRIKKVVLKKGGMRAFLNWILVSKKVGIILPDDVYVPLVFYLRTGKKMSKNDPQEFNEKLQWLKLYNRNVDYIKMVDKLNVKKYVADLIGEKYIIPTIGVADKFDDICFEKLPNSFVLKCTHDSGSVVVCRDKTHFDIEAARKKINRALKTDGYWYSREWPYKFVERKIIIEKYMEDSTSETLRDYKFYCFGGEPKFLYLSEGLENHSTARISYVTLDWQKASFTRDDFKPFEVLPPRPVNFDKMLDFARILSKEIPFARIDFYEINTELYFGEITFYPGGGYTIFHPDKYEKIIGDLLDLTSVKGAENCGG